MSIDSKALNYAKATTFTTKLLLTYASYDTNMISVDKLRHAFPKMKALLNKKEGWDSREKICFQVFAQGDDTIVLSPEDYLFRFELTPSEFTYGLFYLYRKDSIKLKVR